MNPNNQYVIALDYGEKRVGVALTSLVAKLPSPLTTLSNDSELIDNIEQIIREHHVGSIVVGYPRGLDGQTTRQTKIVEDFVLNLKTHFSLPIDLQDEALTSAKAEAELSKKPIFNKAEVDALAATYILEDWLNEQKR